MMADEKVYHRVSINPRLRKLDVIIRGVSPRAYREFKARAAKLGLKLRDALRQAIESYAAAGPAVTSVLADPNNETYEKMRPELLKKYYGKHVAIANGKLVAVADSLQELGAMLRELNITRALGLQVGHEQGGEAGEWLWGSIAQDNIRTTRRE